MILYFACDHAGFEMKEALYKACDAGEFGNRYSLVDCGADSFKEGDNYPFYIAKAARRVSDDATHAPSYAIVLGGSGTGEMIMANRFPHVRACVYQGGDIKLVALAKEHNDANVLSLGARFITLEEAKEAVRVFLTTPFSHDERHVERIIQIEEESRC